MPEKVTEEMLREAEFRRLQAQAERDNAEKGRIQEETLEISRRLSQRWWHVRLVVLIQVAVAGIVAAALISGFLLDHFLAVTELIQKQQTALKKETADALQLLDRERTANQRERSKLSDDLRAVSGSYTDLKTKLAAAETRSKRELADLQAVVDEKNAQLASAQLTSEQMQELKAAKEKAESKITVLTKELMRITEASEAATNRADDISIQRFSNSFRQYAWKFSYGFMLQEDTFRFDAGGRMRYRRPLQVIWRSSHDKWRIEDNELVVCNMIVGYRLNFPLSGIQADATRIEGSYKAFASKTEVTFLERMEVIVEYGSRWAPETETSRFP